MSCHNMLRVVNFASINTRRTAGVQYASGTPVLTPGPVVRRNERSHLVAGSRAQGSLRRPNRGMTFVCRVASKDTEEAEEMSGAFFKGSGSDDDLLSAMQTMAATMQRKLNSLNKVLETTRQNNYELEEELEKERTSAKDTRSQLEAEVGQLEAQIEELRQNKLRLETELSDTVDIQHETAAALESVEAEKKKTEKTIKNMERDFQREALRSAELLERRLLSGKRKTDRSKLAAAQGQVRELQAELAEAKHEASVAQAEAQSRLSEEVEASRSAFSEETEWMALEAHMAAEAAAARANVVAAQVQHQGELVAAVQRVQEEKEALAADLAEAGQRRLELEHQVDILMREIEDSRAQQVAAEARASSSEATVEKKSARLIQEAQDKVTVLTQERDAAVTIANAKAAAMAAAEKRAEAAEAALQSQSELMERCSVLEMYEEDWKRDLAAAEDKIVTLESQVSLLNVEATKSESQAVDLQAKLEALKASMDERIAKAEEESRIRIRAADDHLIQMEGAMQLKTEQAEAAMEAMRIASEATNKRMELYESTAKRNLDALRSVVSSTTDAMHMWRTRALEAEEDVTLLRRTAEQGAPAGEEEGAVQLHTGYGRLNRTVEGKDLRRLLAKGPRREENEADDSEFTSEQTSKNSHSSGDYSLYSTTPRDFGTAIGMNWEKYSGWQEGIWCNTKEEKESTSVTPKEGDPTP